MAKLMLDGTGVEIKERGYALIPNGKYIGGIEDVEIKKSQKGVEYLNIKWKILEGQYANRVLFEAIFYNSETPAGKSYAFSRILEINKAFGVEELAIDTDLLRSGKKFEMSVYTRKNKKTDGTEEDVNAVGGLKETSGVVAQQPALQMVSSSTPALVKTTTKKPWEK